MTPAAMTAARTERHESAVVRRLVNEVMNDRRLDVLDDLCTTAMARRWRRWVTPFLASFPDMRMDIVQLVTEGDTVVGHFTCSATHTGEWRGHAASGRRFENVDEVYFFEFEGGRIANAWGIEDTLDRLRQLGLTH
jgi:predicted ester cyclase